MCLVWVPEAQTTQEHTAPEGKTSGPEGSPKTQQE